MLEPALTPPLASDRWRLAALCAALALYGFLSAPAPPEIRVVEAVVGALLVATVGVRTPMRLAAARTLDGWWWEAVGTLAFLWLFWVPLLRGAWLGWGLGDVLRDLVPAVYLFVPLLLVPALRRAGPHAVEALAAALMLAGLFFALRWWRQADWGFGAVGLRAMGDGRMYFLNAPSVLFAAIGLPASGLALAARGGWLRGLAGLVLGLVLGLAGALCLAALAGAVHRMALVLALPALAGAALCHARRGRAGGIVLLALALLAAVGSADALSGAFGQLGEKTRLAGANTRWEEAMAAVEQAASSPATFLFGEGWGGLLANPAVGGWRVSYTHTLATYTLVKAGAFGLMALALWLGGLAPILWRALRADPPLALAALPPLAVSLLAHTSFKYLDTGILLTLLVLAGERAERPRGYSSRSQV